MEQIYFPKIQELKRNIAMLESSLDIKIEIQGKLVSFSGSGLNEYEASLVLEAISFGFSAKKALLLKSEDYQFRTIRIKDFTRKKNIKEVKARVIGKEGKTLRTIKNISNAYIILNEDKNEIGLIDLSENMEETSTALQNLIRGTKQSNVYHYLEKQNRNKKDLDIK